MEASFSGRRAAGHIYGLDGLRALAIIGVTLFHMFPYKVRGGYLGVSLFFVLSGYLLVKTSERKERQGSWRVLPYYLKRIRRIYPGLLVVLFVTTGAYFYLARQAVAGIRPELRSILLGYNNWWQISQNADYFTRITNASPFTPMWFLAIEMQFYLIWPLVFALFLWLRRNKSQRAGLYFLIILTAVSAVLTPVLYRPGNDVTRLYYGTDTRIYGLLAGVLLGVLESEKRLPRLSAKRGRRLALPMLAVLLAVTVFAYIRMDGQKAFAYRGGMILMTLLFCVLLMLAADSRLPVGQWLEAGPLVWIGKNSYEIYLWQYPVIFLFMYRKWGEIPGMPVLEIVLILVLAAWLHWLTEVITKLRIPKSMREAGTRKRFAALGAAGLTVFLFFSGIAGAAVAPSEKFAQKDELEQRLAENQRMLREMQDGRKSGSSGSGYAAAASGAQAVPGSTGAASSGASGLRHYLYADPELQNAAEVSSAGVLMIGDSIMLDSSPQILEQLPDCHIDAEESRQVSESADIAQVLVNEGWLNKTVVISLGTNGPVQEDDVRVIMNVFGPEISVFWVNLYGRTVTWEKESNHLLKALQREYPNLSVIDWCSLIKKHPEWLWDDGEHPNPEGAEGYALLIRESLEAAEANQ